MKRFAATLALLSAVVFARGAHAEETTYRLYDGITAFVANPEGKDFTVTLDVRDINHRMHGPSELLVKVYPPDGKPVVREIIPDDGVLAHTAAPPAGGWDHEAWYYATCYSRGLEPLVRWSSFSNPQRLAAMPKRTFTYQVQGGQKGVYRVMLAGSPDHYVTLKIDPALKYGVAGSPEWLHGHGDLYRRSYIYIPRGAESIALLFIQFDEPAGRTFTVKNDKGVTLASGSGADGLVQTHISLEPVGKYDEQILTLEVSDGPGDYLINATHAMFDEIRPVRGTQAVTAVMAPDAATAKALQNGAIYHDGRLFWQMHQVRLYDWLAKLKPEDFNYPAELEKSDNFISVGSHNSPKPGSADRIMHTWSQHKNPQALNAAIKEMFVGLRLIGHGDHVAIGPKRNLAYEMGCYTFFWYRPAWRIIEQSDAPPEVKEILREFIIQTGDRLAFCRTVATGNGNAFGSLMEGLRYCYEASGDPMQKEVFETVWKRFTSGGYGDRVGIGPSGGLQESMGYDYHYGSYVLRGWKAVIADLKDPRFIEARNRMLNLYSYLYAPEGGNPWSSRTSIPGTAGGTYNHWDQEFRWKGLGGPDFTSGVNDHNEWFAARRRDYYMVTYHGRLTPTWEGEGFHGQIGLGGGGICQLTVIGKGQVLSAKPNGSYGSGNHLSQWRNFHVHSVVGTTADGKPLVTANSEHFNARIDGNTVTSSAEVRESSVRVTRSYTYGPSAIDCEVSLAESIHDNVYSLWGGRPALRGKLTEGYEMIPFAETKSKTGKGATSVEIIAADGKPAGPLSAEPREAGAVLIDRGGYGAMIEFDAPRPVTRGQNDTLLVQLVNRLTTASEVAFKYRIVPFSGERPKLGDIAGKGKQASPIAVLEKVASPDKVRELLTGAEPALIKDSERVLASLRFAVAGDDLAVMATVEEAQVVQNSTVWKGSCVEVFGGTPGRFDVGQVFLVPQAGDAPATAFKAKDGKQAPAPEIRLASTTTKSGYELTALIPLNLLKIDREQGKLLLEFQVGPHDGRKGRVYKTLYGSARAYEDNRDYGLYELAQ